MEAQSLQNPDLSLLGLKGIYRGVPRTREGDDMSIANLPEERQILDLLGKGEEEKGKKLLLEVIAVTAGKGRFEDAENLRKWLIEIDPMALDIIVKAAKIIDNEKIAVIDEGHLATWSDLLEIIDLNEFSGLYHSLEHRWFADGEMIAGRGSAQSVLYFINSGRVELFLHEDEKDVPVRTMGQGEILGADFFFEASIWTINARSLGAELSCLELDRLQQYQTDFPALEANLYDFCRRFRIHRDSMEKIGRDCRVFERFRIDGRVIIRLLDKAGNTTGIRAKKGDLFDISAGGVSLRLLFPLKKYVRLFFGRKVNLAMELPTGSMFKMTGIILSLRIQPYAGRLYTVNVRFSRMLHQDELKNFVVEHE